MPPPEHDVDPSRAAPAAPEAQRLRRAMRDMVALSTLPAIWAGAQAHRIPASLADVLRRTLDLDLIYVEVSDGAFSAHALRCTGPADDAAAAPLRELLQAQTNPAEVADPVSGARLHAAVARFGLGGVSGQLLAASAREGFPSEEDRVLLGVAANHAGAELYRRSAERQLKATREHLNAVFDSAADGIYVMDTRARCTYINPIGAGMLGYEAHELLDRSLHEIIHHSHPDGTPHPIDDCPIMKALGGGVAAHVEQDVFWHKDGRAVPVSYSVAPVIIEGERRGAVVTYRDMTEPVRLSREQQRLMREVDAERARLAEVFDHSQSFMAVLFGPDHVFERANRMYLELVGHRDVVGKPVREAIPEAVDQGFVQLLDRVYRTGEPYKGSEVPVRLQRADGTAETRYLDFVYQPMRGADGEITGVFVQGIDLTERKRSEGRLANVTAESERWRRLYETILASTPDLVYVFDLEHRFTYANQTLLELWGRTWDEAIGKTCLELGYEPWHAQMHDREIEQVKATKRPIRGEVPFTGTQGRRFYDYIFVPVIGPSGEVEAVAGSTRDVTERKQSQQELEALLGRETRRANLLGRVAEAGRRLNAVLDVDAISAALAEEARQIIGAREASTTLTIPEAAAPQPAGAAPRPLRGGLAVPLVGHGGRPLGVIQLSGKSSGEFTAEDEAVLVQLAAIASAGIENARFYKELREQGRRKDEFLATLAHELRNPLAPVRSGLAVLDRALRHDGTEKVREMMNRQVGHMVRLIDDLLDVSRITSGKVQLRPETVELKAVLEAAIEVSRPAIDRARHTLTVSIPPGPIRIHADPTRIAQVVSNILNNAAKYTRDGGYIELWAEADAAQVSIRVRDNGIGLAPETVPEIFELFTQVGKSLDRAQGGLGIGLALVKKLVEMHRGSVTAESAGIGKGSTFTVTLPLAAAQAGSAGGRELPIAGGGQTWRVLVVDDNEDAAETLATVLQMSGHEVRTCHTGPAALEEAASFRPEVVLLDIGLPGIDGYEVARRLRATAWGVNLYLVAITGWGTDEDRKRTRQAGFDDHLTKPVEFERLEQLLANFTHLRAA